MMYLKSLVDKALIFVCTLIIYLAFSEPRIATVLVSIAFGGFLSYVDSKKLKAMLIIGFLVLCFYYPVLMFFLPVIVYDMFFYSYQAISVVVLIPLVNFVQSQPIQSSLTVIVLSILSVLLRYRSNIYSKLYSEHINLSDATREMSMTLTDQRKNLLRNRTMS